MREHKAEILKSIVRAFASSDLKESYRRFLSESNEGQRRMNVVYELILKALHGNLQPLIDDQFRTGYARAIENIPLDNTLAVQRIIERVMVNEFLARHADTEMNSKDLFEETRILGFVIDKAKEAVSHSYLQTREEIIEKRSKQIEGLYKLRSALDENMGISELSRLFVDEVSRILGAPHVILTIYNLARKKKEPAIQLGSSQIALDMIQNVRMNDIFNKMLAIRVPHLIDHLGYKMHPIHPEKIETVPSGYWLTIPIFTRQTFYGFLSINTGTLKNRLSGSDVFVVFSVVSKIAQAMERNQTFRILRKSQAELRDLTNKIIYAQEEERKKISAEIHDTLIQRLTAIWYKILYLEETRISSREWDPNDFNVLKKYIDESIKEARRIVYGLRPLMLDELGLQKTIEEHVKMFQSDNAIDVQLVIEGDLSRMSTEKQVGIFRILQEAMENVRKHSDSIHARIVIRCDETGCTFLVEDFGKGRARETSTSRKFSQSHFGLMIMNERAKAMGGSLKYGPKKSMGFIVKGSISCH